MGLFFTQPPSDPQIKEALVAAHAADAVPPNEADRRAGGDLARIRSAQANQSQLRVSRVFWAFVVFGVLAGAGWIADASQNSSSSQALFTFAGSVLTIVVAFLAGEKSGGSS